MPAKILDGKGVAEQIRTEIAFEVQEFSANHGYSPKLAAVLVGDDPGSQVYVRNKELACKKAGISSQVFRLGNQTTEQELITLISDLNQDRSTHGILVQLPLPKHIDTQRVLDAVSPAKDVDAFAPENVGLLMQGRPRFLPCTPHGVMQLLGRLEIPVNGKHVVVVGRSDIVGKPMAMMLVQKEGPLGPTNANASVSIVHSQSEQLETITRQADVLIVAVGRPKMVSSEMIRPGAVVVDVGINRLDGKIVGDVDFDSVSTFASAITPVPGGVGPLTIAMLLRNTLIAAQDQL